MRLKNLSQSFWALRLRSEQAPRRIQKAMALWSKRVFSGFFTSLRYAPFRMTPYLTSNYTNLQSAIEMAHDT